MRGQLGRVRVDPYLAGFAAHHHDAPGILDQRQLVLHLVGDAPQGRAVICRVGRGQGQRDDGHVVDLDRFHAPVGHHRRDAILVGHQLVPDLDQAVLAILADEEPHRDHRLVFARGRVNVFDAIDLAQHGFQRGGNQFLDFLGG